MYSEALSIMDANMVEYMVEQQKKELREQEKELQRINKEIQKQDEEIQRLRALLGKEEL